MKFVTTCLTQIRSSTRSLKSDLQLIRQGIEVTTS
jgi:hypothetical protein